MKKTALFVAALLAAAGACAQTVKLQTTEGDIRIALDAEKAPKTVANFVRYVKAGHYNGLLFHRVIDGFMIQTGGYDAKLKQRPTKPPVPLESHNGLSNLRGSVAMARTNEPNSATSQFFINVTNNDMLNAPKPDGYGYTVFGKVVQGMDVVDKIRTVATVNRGMHQNVPVTPVAILSATEIK